ncbi:MAG: nucleotidyltransferase family protein [Syntrophobacteraceae bacterium]
MQNNDLEAVILVGGRGTRLRSVLSDRPKPMAPVAGKPFLEWLIATLHASGIRRVVLCTGYRSEPVRSYFGNGSKWGMEILYSHEQSPLGTAGAIANALDKVRGERFLALNGDSYCKPDFSRLYQSHLSRRAKATIWLVNREDCRRYGSVAVGSGGEVLAFREKSPEPCSGLINSGIYLLEREVAEAIPSGRAVSIETEIFPRMVGRGLYAEIGEGPFLDIGTPEAYASAEDFFAGVSHVQLDTLKPEKL